MELDAFNTEDNIYPNLENTLLCYAQNYCIDRPIVFAQIEACQKSLGKQVLWETVRCDLTT